MTSEVETNIIAVERVDEYTHIDQEGLGTDADAADADADTDAKNYPILKKITCVDDNNNNNR